MRPVIGIKCFTPDVLKKNPRLMLRINYWLFDQISRDPQAQVCGIVIINTFVGFTLWDQIAMSNMAPMGDQLATFKFFQILGVRFKGAFILQEPSFMSWVWFLAKPFMSEKITSRFHLCGHRTDILKENVPDFSILPNHLGGDLPDDDVAINSWITDRVADMSKKEPSQG